jgi:hypothetical protein
MIIRRMSFVVLKCMLFERTRTPPNSETSSLFIKISPLSRTVNHDRLRYIVDEKAIFGRISGLRVLVVPCGLYCIAPVTQFLKLRSLISLRYSRGRHSH